MLNAIWAYGIVVGSLKILNNEAGQIQCDVGFGEKDIFQNLSHEIQLFTDNFIS